MSKTLKPIKNNTYVKEILKDVTGINLSEQEVTKLSVFLRYENSGTLFDTIPAIYGLISANFNNPSKFVLIPYLDSRGMEHVNIQKICG